MRDSPGSSRSPSLTNSLSGCSASEVDTPVKASSISSVAFEVVGSEVGSVPGRVVERDSYNKRIVAETPLMDKVDKMYAFAEAEVGSDEEQQEEEEEEEEDDDASEYEDEEDFEEGDETLQGDDMIGLALSGAPRKASHASVEVLQAWNALGGIVA